MSALAVPVRRRPRPLAILLRGDPADERWVRPSLIAVLAILTFAPFPFVHPLRVARLRTVNIVLLAIWSVLAAAALGRNLDPGPWITAALCAIALYFIAAGLIGRSAARRGMT